MPNSSSDEATNIAELTLAAVPSARTMSTTPSAIATGNVPAWIQPRQVGFVSETAKASESSSNGRLVIEFGADSSAATPAGDSAFMLRSYARAITDSFRMVVG